MEKEQKATNQVENTTEEKANFKPLAIFIIGLIVVMYAAKLLMDKFF